MKWHNTFQIEIQMIFFKKKKKQSPDYMFRLFNFLLWKYIEQVWCYWNWSSKTHSDFQHITWESEHAIKFFLNLSVCDPVWEGLLHGLNCLCWHTLTSLILLNQTIFSYFPCLLQKVVKWWTDLHHTVKEDCSLLSARWQMTLAPFVTWK